MEVVQVVIYHSISLVVGYSLQGIYGIGLHVDWEELSSEVLVKVSLGLQRKHASIQFLLKEVFRPFYGLTFFKKH